MAPGRRRRCRRPPALSPPPARSTPSPGSSRCWRRCRARRSTGSGSGCASSSWLPFPWRFSRSSLEARREFLRADRGRRVGDRPRPAAVPQGPLRPRLRQRSARAGGRRLRGALRASTARRTRARHRRRSPLGDLEPSGAEEDCDYVVVGSRRRRRGRRRGARRGRPRGRRARGRPVPRPRAAIPRSRSRRSPPSTATPGSRSPMGRPAIPTPVGRAVGGTTVINSGTCFRTPEPVLERWAAEHGIEWARELDPDFAEAEEMLDVRPVDPERMGRNGQLLREGAEALGVSHAPLRATPGAASSAAPARTAAASTRSGRCTSPTCRARSRPAPGFAPGSRRGGRVRRRRAVGVAMPRRRRRSPRGRRRPFDGPRAARRGARRGRVRYPGAAAALGVSLRQRRARAQPAHPPRLLGRRPLRRAGPRLGRGHAELRGRRVAGARRAARGDLHAAGVRRPVAARDRASSTRSACSPSTTSRRPASTSRTGPSGRVALAGDGSLRITYQLTRDDSRRLVFGIARAAELYYAAGAREVYPQVSGSTPCRARGSPSSRPRLRGARRCAWRRFTRWARRGWTPIRAAASPASTAPSTAPKALYVADGSLLPSSIGVNPMITIMAMASRVARQVAAAAAS